MSCSRSTPILCAALLNSHFGSSVSRYNINILFMPATRFESSGYCVCGLIQFASETQRRNSTTHRRLTDIHQLLQSTYCVYRIMRCVPSNRLSQFRTICTRYKRTRARTHTRTHNTHTIDRVQILCQFINNTRTDRIPQFTHATIHTVIKHV